jgi:hypothetical protein
MRGITVTIKKKTLDGTDAFGAPVWKTTDVTVDNVLVGEPSTDDITSSTDLYGKRIDYMLGIPKGDTNDWKDVSVSWTDAYGRTISCETFGFPITGVEALIPTAWHMKVRCHRIE